MGSRRAGHARTPYVSAYPRSVQAGDIVSTVAQDVNATIDHALYSYAEALDIVTFAIVVDRGREALPTINAMAESFKRMASLARLVNSEPAADIPPTLRSVS